MAAARGCAYEVGCPQGACARLECVGVWVWVCELVRTCVCMLVFLGKTEITPPSGEKTRGNNIRKKKYSKPNS